MKKKLLFLVPFLAMVMSGCSNPVTPTSSGQPTSAPTTEPGPTTGTETSESTSPTSESTDTTVTPTSESSDPTTVPTSESSDPTTVPTSESSTGTTPTTESTSEAPEPVPVTGIKMNSSYDVTLQVGGTSQIDAEVLPENADDKVLVYSSTKEEVATVSSAGLVTAVGVGKATINVVAHADSSIKKTVNVVVEPAGFMPASETDDGYSLVTNLNDLANGDLLKIVGYLGGEPYSIKADALNTAQKISYDENDKVVTSGSMGFTFELQMGDGSPYAAIRMADGKYVGSKGNDNGIVAYDDLSSAKTHMSAQVDEEGYALIQAGEGSKNTLLLNGGSSTPYIRFYGEDKISSYRKICLYRKTPQFYTSISVKTPPTKTNYVEGEEFDAAGMEIQANKNYGDPDLVTEFYYAPAIPLTVENTEITIYATVGGEDFECKQSIEVREKVLSSLEVTTPPTKTTYNIGDAFASEGMVVKAIYNKDVEGFERIDEDFKGYTVSPASFTTSGDQKVTLSVDGSEVTAEVDVTVNAATLQSIEVTNPPTKLEYYVGDAFDPEGLVITGTYSDTSTDTIALSSLEFDPATFTEAGDAVEVKATVIGSEISCQITGITVTAVELDHIEVTVEPTLTEYMVRDELDLSGLEVTAYYNNGDEEVLTADKYTTDPEDGYAFVAADVGTKEITVSFGGEEDSFEVSVEAFNGIKRAYEAGEALDAGATTSEEYEMEGVVSAICTGTVDKPYEFLIQDGEYGMYVYTSTQSLYALGDLVKVTSKISNFRGMIETVKITSTEGSKEKIGTGEVPQPVVVTSVEELAAVNQNVLINLENIEIKTPLEGWSSSAHVNTYGVSLNEEDLTLCLKKDVYQESVNTVLTRCKEGEEVKLTHCFKSAFDDVQCRLTLSTSADDSMNTRYVEEIVLDKETLSLVAGGTGQVSVTQVLPEIASDKTYTWTSTNTDIATVDGSGNVTAVAAGDCDIKAVANDEGHAEGVCHVTVTAGEVHVTSVELDKETLSLQVGEGTESLTATVKPDEATNKDVIWESDDEDVATVDENGVVTPVGAGTCTITVTSDDDETKSDTCAVTVIAAAIKDVITRSSLGYVEGGEFYQTITDHAISGGSGAKYNSYIGKPNDYPDSIQVNGTKSGGAASFYVSNSGRYIRKIAVDVEFLATKSSSTAEVHVYGSTTPFTSFDAEGVLLGKATEVGLVIIDSIDGNYPYFMVTSGTSWAAVKTVEAYWSNEVIPSEISGVTLNKESASIGVDSFVQLTATVTGTGAFDDTVTWSSEDESVAKVDSAGKVTGVAAGKTNIIATCNGDTTKSAQCAITVESETKAFTLVTDYSKLTSGTEFYIVAYTSSTYKIYNGSLNSGHLKMIPTTGSTTISGLTEGSTLSTSEGATLKLEGSADDWQITDGTNYLAFTGTGNGNDSFVSGNKTSADSKFSISGDGIVSNTRSGRGLRYNGSTGDLRNYAKGSQGAIYLFAKI